MQMAIAVILAAGYGTRMGGLMPKQFWPIEGRTVLEHTAEAFLQHPGITEVALVVPQVQLQWVRTLFAGIPKVKKILAGGATRSDSSLIAVRAYADQPDVWLLFHDGARPLVTAETITAAIDAAANYEAVTAAIPSVDTILVSKTNCSEIDAIPERCLMYRCQTPQAFRQRVIAKAYELAEKDNSHFASDDCGVIRKYLPEVKIGIIPGSEENIKLTYARDMEFMAEQFRKQ